MNFFGTAVTDIGIVKQTNQDSACVKVAETPESGPVAMVVLCDGMGGLAKGELASKTVIERFANWFDRELPQRLKGFNWEAVKAEWNKIIKEQNFHISEYGKAEGINLGTTISAILIVGGKYMISHVGDSRVYRIKDNIEQLTEDQTFIARELKRGTMTPEQAAVDRRRNMLLQCVGASKEVEPAFYFGDVVPGTMFMLCSDGFRHVLTNEELYMNFIPNITNEQMQKNSEQLIETVKSRNERDNITVALLKCM